MSYDPPISVGTVDNWPGFVETLNLPTVGEPGFKLREDRKRSYLGYYDEFGQLVGGVHYNKISKTSWFQVRPDKQGQGIGRILIDYAVPLFDLQAEKQRYSCTGAAMTRAWLRRDRESRGLPKEKW